MIKCIHSRLLSVLAKVLAHTWAPWVVMEPNPHLRKVNTNPLQDCLYQGEALNVPTAFKVYGAVITLKNSMKFKKMIFFP